MRSDQVPTVGELQLEVAGLGIVKGLSLDNTTCQYLGIPYATIPGRFRRSVLADSAWPNGVLDGTKLGPYCPQPARDFYPVPSPERPWLDAPPTDEFNCLNLNISVPCRPSDVKSPMPVMVFVHGGAFAYSTGSSPIYDGRLLASSSAEQFAKPTIIITFNYRLGVYGFLAGRDLQEYNEAHGELGVGNYGIWDQVIALRWIQKHITAFGGDPNKVTIFGQSAGGVSVNCHLLRDEPLFSSAILQSGLMRLCGVLSIDEYQVIYEKMLLELGISLDLPAKERIEHFLSVDTSRLTAAMKPVFIVPVVTMALCDDGVLVPGSMPTNDDFATFKVPKWCPRVMMGDCKNECIIWNKSWDNLSPIPMTKDADLSTPTAPLLLKKMASYLGPDNAKIIADLYHITEDSHPSDIFHAIEKLTTDGMYLIAIHYAEKSASSSVFAYHFDVPSPFENAWGGYAHHSHDNVLIWGVLKHLIPDWMQNVSEKMSEAWIRFANGEDPWERFSEKERWMVFSREGANLKSKDEDAERGYDIWYKLHELGLIPRLVELSGELCLRKSELLASP